MLKHYKRYPDLVVIILRDNDDNHMTIIKRNENHKVSIESVVQMDWVNHKKTPQIHRIPRRIYTYLDQCVKINGGV